jgi:hypothetical protein
MVRLSLVQHVVGKFVGIAQRWDVLARQCSLRIAIPFLAVVAVHAADVGAQQPLPNPNVVLVRNATTTAVARQSDGKLLIAGSGVANFRYLSAPADAGPRLEGDPGPGPANVSGIPKNGLLRVNADGTLDTSFTVDLDDVPNVGSGRIDDIKIFGNFAYLVGDFVSIGGVARAGLARINLTTNTLDTAWNPNPVPRINGQRAVGNIALDSAGNLYTFGSIYDIGGKSSVRVAKIPATSLNGAADPAFDGRTVTPSPTDDIVANGIAVGPSANAPIYVFGRKAGLGPNLNGRIFRLNSQTGVPDTSWSPDLTAIDMFINSVAVNAAGDLYVGGQARGTATIGQTLLSPFYLAKLSGATGQVPASWTGGRYSPLPDPPTSFVGSAFSLSVVPDGSVYAGTAVFFSDTSRFVPAKFDGVTGLPVPGFSGDRIDGSNSITGYVVVAPDAVYIEGPGYYGGIRSGTVLKLDLATGALVPGFSVNLKEGGFASSSTRLADGRVIFGGAFNEANGVPINNLIRFNTDGTFDPTFTAGPAGMVIGLKDIAGKLYVGGGFSWAGGSPRAFVAKFDSATGALDPTWAPIMDGSVRAFTGDANDVYLVGGFYTINGVVTKCVVKMSAATGLVDTNWVPPLANVSFGSLCQRSIAKVGNYVYLGLPNNQNFSGPPRVVVNGQNRTLARLSATTGQADSTFDPNPLGPVTSMDTDGTNVYVSGNFNSIAGVPTRLAKFNAVSGAIDSSFVQPLTGIPAGPTYIRAAASGIFLTGIESPNNGASFRPFVWKILPSGARDTAWAPTFAYEASGRSFNASAEPLGANRIIIGGGFFDAGLVSRIGIAGYSTTAPTTLTLTVNGKGTVDASSPGGVSSAQCFECKGGPFTYEFDTASTVTLTAKPAPGWIFVGWKGDNSAASCTTTGPCVITLTATTNVSASFRNVGNLLEQ